MAVSAARYYVPQLDGLRFLAFLLVFVHHFTAPHEIFGGYPLIGPLLARLQEFGWAGVDLFLVLSAFHTIEFFFLMLCLSALYPVLMYVVAGMALHMITDLFHISVTLRRPFARAFSLVEYIYKSRTDQYLTSVKELVEQDNLNVNSAGNIHYWLRKWNIPGKT